MVFRQILSFFRLSSRCVKCCFIIITACLLITVFIHSAHRIHGSDGYHRGLRPESVEKDKASPPRLVEGGLGAPAVDGEAMDGRGLEQESLCRRFGGVKVNVTLVEQLVRQYRVDLNQPLPLGEDGDPWAIAEKWVTDREVLPAHAPRLGFVLNAMVSGRIELIDLSHEGHQLKLAITLTGGQRALFKPKWYEIDEEWGGNYCKFHDSPFGEVATFHLSRVLELRKTPLAAGRTLSLRSEILPLATQQVFNFSYQEGNMTCLYGRCSSCSRKKSVCTNDTLEGAMILWLPETISRRVRQVDHPWHGAYQERGLRLFSNKVYCEDVRQSYPFNDTTFFLDLVDAAILQYLVNNADRRIYQVFKGEDYRGRYPLYRPGDVVDRLMVMLDNGKSVRNTTYQRLQLLSKGVLSRVMKAVLSADPLSPVLTDRHLIALDRRLEHVLYEIYKCVRIHGASVALSDWRD